MTELTFTKLVVIKTIGRIYDSLGLISPFAVRAKILLQDIWKKKFNWDDALPLDLANTFQDWCAELFYFKQISVPRHLFSMKGMKELTDCQCLVFVNASKQTYGAAVHVRVYIYDGKYHSNLVTSKTKVAQVQQKTLPSLELLAALIGGRLFHHIKLHLSLSTNVKKNFWSDSMLVLH